MSNYVALARAGTKRRAAEDLMIANSDRPMPEVVEMIAKANGDSFAVAVTYYEFLIARGAPGALVEIPRKRRSAKATVASATEVVPATEVSELAAQTAEFAAHLAQELAPTPSNDEDREVVEAARAANLEAIQAAQSS